jgi:hypothetical protein
MTPSFLTRAGKALQSPSVLLVVYVLLAAGVTLQKLALGPFEARGITYAPLQNFAIFRNAFPHLLAGQDIYAAFPSEQWDLFKYTPTFAVFMAPFAALPYGVGAVGWNLLNALALFAAVMWLPTLDPRARAFTLWFVLLNLVSSLQGAQSNGLMAGLMLAGFAARERGRDSLAALAVVSAAFVKPFGAVALLPCLLQDRRTRFIGHVARWTIVLALAPLLVVSPDQLSFLYRSWLGLLASDHGVKTGVSVMSWLRAWFGLDLPKDLVVAVGALLLVGPILAALHGVAARDDGKAAPARRGAWLSPHASHDPDTRGIRLQPDSLLHLLVMASVLIWVVIFNHMAEPPTYVIAMLGVGLWYFSQPSTPARTALVVATFLLTAMSATDIYPRAFRSRVVSPYVLRAAPCIFVWLALQYELLTASLGARRRT